MRSEKIAKPQKRSENRWYDDACGTALALEFVGERWSLLLIRELMFGPRRFGELKANLPGISSNVLAQRLDGLEAAGIVSRRKLPSAMSVQVYELTPWGYEAEPILQEMGRWATRSCRHDPTLFLSPASAMMSLRTMLDRTKAAAERITIAFHFPTDRFVGVLADGELHIRRGESDAADATFTTDPTTFAAIIYAKLPFRQSEAEGKLTLEGDHETASRFVALFHLPAKIAD
ncbi:MAG TPA: winged helix-turn-helix transcriptional regulator [Sphingomonas sp.]|nr:winged helix-turn-helix transcriptional regulator [Sphingomonas sp.]